DQSIHTWPVNRDEGPSVLEHHISARLLLLSHRYLDSYGAAQGWRHHEINVLCGVAEHQSCICIIRPRVFFVNGPSPAQVGSAFDVAARIRIRKALVADHSCRVAELSSCVSEIKLGCNPIANRSRLIGVVHWLEQGRKLSR